MRQTRTDYLKEQQERARTLLKQELQRIEYKNMSIKKNVEINNKLHSEREQMEQKVRGFENHLKEIEHTLQEHLKDKVDKCILCGEKLREFKSSSHILEYRKICINNDCEYKGVNQE